MDGVNSKEHALQGC